MLLLTKGTLRVWTHLFPEAPPRGTEKCESQAGEKPATRQATGTNVEYQ